MGDVARWDEVNHDAANYGATDHNYLRLTVSHVGRLDRNYPEDGVKHAARSF